MKRHIIFGAPGTGKTTHLLNIMERELEHGIEPERIAYVSFTRKAAREAADRAASRFGFEPERLKWFKTLHAVAYDLHSLGKDEVMQRGDYEKLSDIIGVEFRASAINNSDIILDTTARDGDLYLMIDNLARVRCKSIIDVLSEINSDISIDGAIEFGIELKQYKRDMGLWDYTDMLERREYIKPLDIDVAIIDEAQDLSTLQWQFAEHVLSNAKRVYIAGDDDQAIYHWAGADASYLINAEGERTVLDQSYRLPKSVHDIAERIAHRIKHRIPKHFKSRSELGSVEYHSFFENVDIDPAKGSWYILARNHYQLEDIEDDIRGLGVPYSTVKDNAIDDYHVRAIYGWEHLRKGLEVRVRTAKAAYDLMGEELSLFDGMDDEDHFKLKTNHVLPNWYVALTQLSDDDREYYSDVLTNGYHLTAEPQIHIGTIHSVKGGEADNVVLFTDMSAKTYDSYLLEPDAEHRVFYVGATRARSALHIILPQGVRGYEV